MWFLWTVTAGWAALITFALFLPSGADPGLLGSLFMLALGWVPFAVLVFFVRTRKAGRDARYSAMSKAAGFTGKNGYEHREDASGIVLNREQRVIGLVDGRIWKVYPFDALREWQSSKETAGMIVGGGLASLGANLGAEQRAKANSGLFITVRDIDQPVWRVAMLSAKDQARWMEILRQEVNQA